MKNVIINPSLNKFVAFLLMIIFFIIIEGIYRSMGILQGSVFERRLLLIISVVVSIGFVWKTSDFDVPNQTRYQLLLWGNNTHIYVPQGNYFIFFHRLPLGRFRIFRLQLEESQNLQKRDVLVTKTVRDDKGNDVKIPFKTQDKNGKLLEVDGNADWEIGSNRKDPVEADEIIASDNYRKMDEAQVVTNLQSLLRRTIIRVIGRKDFWVDIIGHELHTMILEDKVFQEECFAYGIRFKSLILEVTSGDLTQDNLNYFEEQLNTKFKARYGTDHVFTPKDLERIHEDVQAQLKIAKKIIVKGSETLVRINTKDGVDE